MPSQNSVTPCHICCRKILIPQKSIAEAHKMLSSFMVLIKHLQQICGQLSKELNYYFSCLRILSSHFSIGNSYDNRFLPLGQFQLL